MLVNHVLSNDTVSGIFDAIFGYFSKYSSPDVRFEVTIRPIDGADIHHFHRPHLESRLPKRSVVTVHHDLHDPDPWLDIDKFLPRYAESARVVCLNRGQRDFLEKRGISRTEVVPHGYNDEVLVPKTSNPRDRDPDGAVSLGLFSKYYDRRFKGEAYLHDLVKRLDPRRFRFVLVGERRLVTGESLASLGFGVRVYERLPYRLFQSAYDSIDYLLMCSNFEGGPANLPEAMATHTPILATPVGFAPDYLIDGQNALILTGDPDFDGHRISQLAEADSALARQLDEGAASLRRAIPTWRDVVARYLEIYRRVAEE